MGLRNQAKDLKPLSLSFLRTSLLEHPASVEVHEDLTELLVVEDPLEDGLIVVHPPDQVPMNIRSKTSRKFSMVLFLACAVTSGSASQVSSN